MPKFVTPSKSKPATPRGTSPGTRNLSNGPATRSGGGGHTNTTGKALNSDPRSGPANPTSK